MSLSAARLIPHSSRCSGRSAFAPCYNSARPAESASRADGPSQQLLHQLPGAVIGHPAHHQCSVGAFDSLDAENISRHAIEIFTVAGDDMNQQVRHTAEPQYLEHFG